MITKRMKACLITGALLGVTCIVGALIRSGFNHSPIYLFSFWYNRVLIGLVVGFASQKIALPKAIVRGAILGLFISFAFYSSTGFADPVGFLAGIVYGIIIEIVARKFSDRLVKS